MTIIASFSSIDASLWKSFERVKWNLKCEEMIEKRDILIYPDLRCIQTEDFSCEQQDRV